MAGVPKDYQLSDDQHDDPITWLEPWDVELPVFTDEDMEAIFGPLNAGNRIRGWAHDVNDVHWLATRRGTTLHVDKGFLRYTSHVIVRNDGWRTRGLTDVVPWRPRLVPGTTYSIDSWSPHWVVPDPRLTKDKPLYKVDAVWDSQHPATPEQVKAMIAPFLERADKALDRITLPKRAKAAV